jgi:HAD superfamily hydrolase (TIGR01490 family)
VSLGGQIVLAIFDVDHTLIRGDSLIWFGRFILKKRWPRIRDLPDVMNSLFRYFLGFSDSGRVKSAYLRMLCGGMQRSHIKSIVKEFTYEVLLPNVFAEAKNRIRWHQTKQQQVILLSASPVIYLEELASALNVNGLIGTHLICQDGVLTGDLAGKNCKGVEKLERLIAAYKSRDIDWKGSYGYSDSASDIPVLERVGNPIIINPSRRFAKVGIQRQWKIEYWE